MPRPVPPRTARPLVLLSLLAKNRSMPSGAIVRVLCVDGPCQGLQYLNPQTGRIVHSDVADGAWCIYRVSAGEMASTVAGSFPAAYFDRFNPPAL
jgi:hypothetical protein